MFSFNRQLSISVFLFIKITVYQVIRCNKLILKKTKTNVKSNNEFRTGTIIILLLTTLITPSYGQNIELIDSLMDQLEIVAEKDKIVVLKELCWEYRDSYPERANVFGKQALDLSIKYGNRKEEAEVNNYLGVILRNQGMYSNALEYFYQAHKIAQEADLKSVKAYSLNNVADIYNRIGLPSLARENNMKAYEIFTLLSDTQGVAYCKNIEGLIFINEGNYTRALESFKTSLQIREEIKHINGIATTAYNLGIVCFYLEDHSEAMNYFERSLKIYLELNDKSGIASCYNGIGQYYNYIQEFEKAIKYFRMSMLEGQQLASPEILKQSTEGLTEAYAQLKDFEKAFGYQRLFKLMTDSLSKAEHIHRITQLEYAEKERILKLEQENQQKVQQAKLEKETVQKWSLAMALFLTLALFFILGRLYYNKRKSHEILSKQKDEISNKNIVLNHQKDLIQAQANELALAIDELKKLSIVASEIDNAVMIMDMQGYITWVNTGFTKMYGYNDAELRELPGKNIIDISTNPHLHRIIRRCVAQKESVQYQSLRIHQSRKRLWIQTTITPVLNDNKEVVKLVAIDADITTVKEAERLISFQKRELKIKAKEINYQIESLKNLSMVASEVDNAVMIMDIHGNIQWLNNGFKKMYGYPEKVEELYNENIAEISTKPHLKRLIAKCVETKEAFIFESLRIHKSKQRLWIQTTITPILDDNNKVIRLIAVDSDITRLKEAEREIIQKKEELEEQKNEIKRQAKELRKLSKVASEIDNAVTILAEDGKIEWVNAGFGRMYGYKDEEILNIINEDFVEISTNPHLSRILKKCKKDKKSVNFESLRIHKSEARRLWIQTTITPILDTDNEVEVFIAIDSDITRIKEAEREILKRKEEIEIQRDEIKRQADELRKLSTVVSQTDNAVVIADPNGNFLWANNAFSRMYGYSLEEFVRERGTNLMNISTSPYFNNAIRDCISLKKSVVYEYATQTKKGFTTWVHTTLTPVLSEDNDILYLIAIDSDITKTKDAEQKIIFQKEEIQAQAEQLEYTNKELEKLSIVASKTANAIAILDEVGNFEWVNESFTRLYGYNYHQFVNEKGRNILECTDDPDIIMTIKSCIYYKKIGSYEFLAKNRGGKELWIHTTISPILDEDGKLKKIITIDSDISNLKAAEQEIYQQKEEIQTQAEQLYYVNKELEKLSIVASETDNSVVIVNRNGEIEWVNKGFTRLFGYTLPEFIETIGDSNLFRASQSEEYRKAVQQCRETKKSVIYSSKIPTKWGTKIWLQTTLTPILSRNDEIEKFIAIDSNISRLKNAEEKIAQQNREIRDSLLYASKIQEALFPMTIFIDAIFPSHFILNKPRDIVSGDFYWMAYKQEKAIAVVADCTGHGVPGAFMSMLGIASLKSILNKMENIDAGIMLNQLRERIIRALHQRGKDGENRDGMDIAVCIFDFKQKKMQYAGANNSVYLLRESENKAKLIELKADKMPIGLHENMDKLFNTQDVDLQTNDMIYIFTDGYIDQFGGEHNKKFMSKRFKQFLKQTYTYNPDIQKERLNNELVTWQGEEEQVDDILIMGIKV